MFSGFGPSLQQANSWGLLFIWELSFNKWGNEALYSATLNPVRHVFDVENSAELYGYTLGREYIDIVAMFVIGIIFRVLAYISLRLVNRDKQQ